MSVPTRASTVARWLLIWTAVCSIFVAQNVSRYVMRGQPVDWFQAVALEALYWVPWFALTPILLGAARRYPLDGTDTWRAVRAHLLVMLPLGVVQTSAAILIELAAIDAFRPPAHGLGEVLRRQLTGAPSLLITAWWKYWVFMGVFAAIRSVRRLRERELRAAQLESQLATAQLQALKAQLHPHFLFNTLHAISMLHFVDVDAANRILVQLSELLRLALDRSDALEVPVAQEIDFLDRYLQIEQTRFDDRLDVTLDVDDAALDAAVPNLILQPLVENALRHGIAPRADAGRLVIRARTGGARGERLLLEVEDDGPGLARGWSLDTHAGVGLANVRDRLQLAFGAEASLQLTRATVGGGTIARVEMPFARAPERDATAVLSFGALTS